MKNFILIGLFVVLLPIAGAGDDFRYLRTKEGLYDGEINSITQDSTGNMWFATWSGLIRYDGYNFEHYRPVLGNPASLQNKKTKLVYTDSRDNLWIATSTGLSRYNKINNSFEPVQFEKQDNPEVNIYFLGETAQHLIIHTTEGFYTMPSDSSGKDTVAQKCKVVRNGKDAAEYFHSSVSFDNHLLLISNTKDFSTINFVELWIDNGTPLLNIIRTIEIEGPVNDVEYVPVEKNIYIATTDGLHPWSLETGQFTRNTYFDGKDILKIKYTSNHKLYCALPGPELLWLDLHTGKNGSHRPNPNILGTLIPNNIHDLYEDFSGNLWVGHQGQGLSILNLYHKKFYSYKRDPQESSTLNSNTVMCFEATDQEVFIGCRSGGLNIVSRHATTSEKGTLRYKSLPVGWKEKPGAVDDGIWDIQKQSDSVFWLGTDLGLFKLQRVNSEWKMSRFEGSPHIGDMLRKVYIDANDNIWCGTQHNGLIFIPNLKINRQGRNFRFAHDVGNPESLSSNEVHDIYIDNKNRFWVATQNGLNRLSGRYDNLDLSGKTKPDLHFTRYVATTPQQGYLNNNEINSIYENFDGTIWLATQGGGINILDPESEQFSYMTVNDGLPSNDVIGMLTDEDGNLWISTINGLASYNRFSKTPYFNIFDNTDGIQNETFMVNSFYRTPDGQMFFGGDNGFTTFFPRTIGINEIKPKIAFSAFSFRGQLVQPGDTLPNGFVLRNSINHTDKIVLPFVRSYFKLDVSTVHYQQPQKNRFSYILEGYMNGWATVPTENNAVEFANLPQGTYTLKVKAVSSDNVESDNIKTLMIEIQPPWYRTWYMTSLFSLVAVLLVMGLIYIIVNRQRLIYQKKLDRVALESNESKMMFLTNIAHELRTPLSLVIAPIEDLMRNNSTDNTWKSHLQLIHRNSNYLLRLINQIIDFRRLNAGKLALQLKETDLVRVVKDVVLNFKGYKSSRNISLYLRVPSDSVVVSVDAQKMEEVLYNLISNAFKHTQDNHSITVSMQVISETPARKIRISVTNEGKEISEEDKSRIFERFYKVDEKSEGAGIGLSFAKSLVEMHNGTVEVESVPGKGVTFHVDLPFNDITIGEGAMDEPETEIVYVKPAFQRDELNDDDQFKDKASLLIVEDNEELREFLYSFFARYFNCVVANDGKDALGIIKNINPALVISDVILDGMDGFELCRTIKEDIKTCHIPVILLTAKNSGEQMIQGYEFGADAYMTKPFDINLLLAQVTRLIKNRELIREKYKTQNFMVEMEKSSASKDEQFVQMVKKILEKNIADPEFNVNRLSDELNISSTQLYRRLKGLTGYSPVEFIRILKLQKAYTLLGEQNNTVKEVCYLTGFNNMSYFIKCFREQFGVTPAYFRDNGLNGQENRA